MISEYLQLTNLSMLTASDNLFHHTKIDDILMLKTSYWNKQWNRKLSRTIQVT